MRHNEPAGKASVVLSIQYLRGVAALMVVWHHATSQIPGLQALFPLEFGTSGVDLFFVISGFIMVVTTHGTSMGPWQFLRRRIIRVAPLYWLLTLSMVTVALVVPSLFKTLKVAPVTLIQSLLFVPHFSQAFPGMVWPLLVPGWTLNFEMFFYALFALSLCLPARRRLTGLAFACLAFAGVGLAFGPFHSPIAQTYTSPMLLEFACGAVIGSLWLGGHRAPVLASALMAIVGTAMLVARDREPLGYFTQMIGAALVVMGVVHPRLSAWHSRLLQGLGDSSYSMYLTHLYTLGVLRIVWNRISPGSLTLPEASIFMILALVACAGVGWLAHRWIEKPLLSRLSRPQQATPRITELARPQ